MNNMARPVRHGFASGNRVTPILVLCLLLPAVSGDSLAAPLGAFGARAETGGEFGAVRETGAVALDASVKSQQPVLRWTQATPNAAWTARWWPAVVAYDGKLWVLGGMSNEKYTLWADVWYTTDGRKWHLATGNAPWLGRTQLKALSFDGKMWVIGGSGGGIGELNDVWYSSDGVTWTQATESAAWGPRSEHHALVHDGKMWVLGGEVTGMGRLSDVWYSSDGVTWTEATSNAAWGSLAGSAMAVFDNRMWVYGGYDLDISYLVGRVWSSTDGANWTYEGDCGARADHTATVFADNVWLLAGNYQGYEVSGAWYSPDGSRWARSTPDPPWKPRTRHASVAFDNKLWILGGLRHPDDKDVSANDVWYAEVVGAAFSATPRSGDRPLSVQFTDESTWLDEPITARTWDFGDGEGSDAEHPVHTYTTPGTYTVSLTIASASGSDTETKAAYIVVLDRVHSADRNADGVISLSELLRAMQFYHAGALHCDAATEDTYAPGPGDETCAPHDSDYQPQDWRISFSELLRLFQLYNAGAYHPCPTGEEGFCPGG